MRPLRKTTHARNKLSSTMLASSSADLGLSMSDVVLVFAASENFVPYLSVALQSLVDNVSDNRHYDVVVLTRNITPTSMITLTRQVTRNNIAIGFLDVDAALGSIELPHHGHFRPETYYRLLAPSLLPNVDKAIYLDSDLVIHADVAELFDTDIEGLPLAATRDADTLGQILGYDATVGPYLRDELGMNDPLDYFQAGVILMNLAELRRTTTPQDLLELCCQRTWRWLDQDVLNRVANGSYKRVHMKWNYLVDWQRLRRTHIVPSAPADVRAEYEEAAHNPCIIHFAGPDNRPWLYPDADCADIFWHYAMRSPYLDELRGQLEESRASVRGLARRLRVLAVYQGFMPAFDKACPPGSRRRSALVKTYMDLGGATL